MSRDPVWDAFARAKRELASHPSVRSLELGWKVSGGELRSELAVRVYVDRKLAPSDVPADLRIPATVAGLPTDVLAVREEELLGHDMIGGDKITRAVWNEPGSGWGTLGYIARRTADNADVMISNEHVFRSDLGVEPRRREVYQPDISCRALGSKCNYVGYVTDGQIGDFNWPPDGTDPHAYFIDCAVADIDAASSRRGVKGISPISGHQDITVLATGPGGTPLAVKKMGAKTGLTEGVVVSVNSTGHQQVGPLEIENQPLTILIRATNGPMFNETIEVQASRKTQIVDGFRAQGGPGTVTKLPGNRLRFEVPDFVRRGDSGSVVVASASGGIVGLLYSRGIFDFLALDTDSERTLVPVGEGRACHIGPVMSRLGVELPAATAPSAGVSAGHEALTAGDPVGVGIHDSLLAARIGSLEQQLNATRRGRGLAALVREHGREMVDLVHHRRPATVCWHGHQGPAHAALVIEAIRDPTRSIPRQHRGVTLVALLAAMCDVLVRGGSSALCEALLERRAWMLEWISANDSIAGLVAALEGDDAPFTSEAAHV